MRKLKFLNSNFVTLFPALDKNIRRSIIKKEREEGREV